MSAIEVNSRESCALPAGSLWQPVAIVTPTSRPTTIVAVREDAQPREFVCTPEPGALTAATEGRFAQTSDHLSAG
jgi:hypothetical protein